MDPITAFQVAASVITFVEFGVELIHIVKEVRDSAEGVTKENRLRAAINRSMRPILDAISTSDCSKIPEDKGPLYNLALECQRCHKEMDDLLGRLAAKGKGRLDKLMSSFKAIRNEPELKKLESRLDKCRLQISAHQIQIQGKRLTEFYQVLQTQGNNGLQMVETMQKHVGSIRADLLQLRSKIAQDNLSLILTCHEEALAPIYANRIQKKLHFKETVLRYSSIDNPKEGTFSWIFNDTCNLVAAEHSSPGKDNHDIIGSPRFLNQKEQIKRAHMRNKFITWLSSSDGIFHFTGIPGAGKSTMMKFIYENPATNEGLQKWAGSRTLCLAKHFFWRPGSDLQHNLAGLFYSLLHEIFKSCPELIPDAMPEYWEMVKQMPIGVDPDIEIPPIAVENALFSLLQDQNVVKDHCFGFFIDGLDEFLGSDQQDYTSLANLLTRWVQKSNGSLKICVSSREENAFMNAFPQDQRLQLHQLTWNDISTYVCEGLQGLETGYSKDELIYKICDRAKGVFLWVILVVRDIRERIESGETNPKVIEANISIPEGLENLISHTLHRLSSKKRKKLTQVVAMLRLPRQFKHELNGLSLTPLAFSFLDKYNSDPKFVTKTTFNEDKTHLYERRLRAEKQLRYCSGGFLKISEQGEEVVFIHRSIPEVLDKEEFRRLLGYVDTAEAAKALSYLTFAQVRAGTYNDKEAGSFLASVMAICLKALDESVYDCLACIDTWYNHNFPLEAPEAHCILPLGLRSYTVFHGLGYVPLASRPIGDHDFRCFNALFYAAMSGDIKFAKFIVGKNPDYLNQSWIRAQMIELLLFIPFSPTRSNISAWNSLMDGEFLKEHPNCRFTIRDLPYPLEDAAQQLSGCNISIWQLFLTWAFFNHLAERHNAGDFTTIEWFLTHGASTAFEAKIYSQQMIDGKTEICIFFGNNHISFLITPEYISPWATWNPKLFKLQTISLREWITHFAPDNMEKLLVLINASPESENHHPGDVHPRNAPAQNKTVLAVSKEQKPAIEPGDARSGREHILAIKRGHLAAYVDFRAAVILATLALGLIMAWMPIGISYL